MLLLVTPTPVAPSRDDPLADPAASAPFGPTTQIEAALVERFGAAAARYAPSPRGAGIAITLASTESARDARTALEREFYTLVGSRLTERFAWAAEIADLFPRDSQKRTRRSSCASCSGASCFRDGGGHGRRCAGARDAAQQPSARSDWRHRIRARARRHRASFERWRRRTSSRRP